MFRECVIPEKVAGAPSETVRAPEVEELRAATKRWGDNETPSRVVGFRYAGGLLRSRAPPIRQETTMNEPTTEQRLALNVKSRKVANETVELGITLAKEHGLHEHPEHFRRMWQYVMETAGELIGDKVVEPERKQVVPIEQEWSTPGHELDDEPFPFGKYKGDCYSDIPEDYFHWLAEQEWIEEWPDVHQYLEEMGYV